MKRSLSKLVTSLKLPQIKYHKQLHVHNKTPVVLEANCMTVLDVSTPDTSGISDVFDTPDTTSNMLACCTNSNLIANGDLEN